MRRSIKYPVILLVLPQVAVMGFYGLLKAVGIPWDVRAAAYAIAGGLAIVVTIIVTLVGLFSGLEFQAPGWLKEDAEDARRLRERREEELRRLDAEIGIPRIPVRK